MQELNSKWWNSAGADGKFTQPAAQFSTRSCQYHTDKKPHQCNPSCG